MKNLQSLKSDKTQFYLILALAILSFVIPDALPFIDEVVLSYLALAKLREIS